MTVFIANQFIALKCIQTEKGIPCKLWESNFSIWLSSQMRRRLTLPNTDFDWSVTMHQLLYTDLLYTDFDW